MVARIRVERLEGRYLIMKLYIRKGTINIVERLDIILIYIKLKYNTLYYYILQYYSASCARRSRFGGEVDGSPV